MKVVSTVLLAAGSLLCSILGGILSDKKSEIQIKEDVAAEVEKQLAAREAKKEETEES